MSSLKPELSSVKPELCNVKPELSNLKPELPNVKPEADYSSLFSRQIRAQSVIDQQNVQISQSFGVQVICHSTQEIDKFLKCQWSNKKSQQEKIICLVSNYSLCNTHWAENVKKMWRKNF